MLKRSKIYTICIIMLFVIMISGCGTKSKEAPTGVNQKTFDLGEEVLDITDQYLDGKIEISKAAEQVSEYVDKFEDISTDDSAESMNNELISITVEAISYDLGQVLDTNSNDNSDVELDRDVLAQYLGEEVSSKEAD